MSALAVAAVAYALSVSNTYDKQKFNAGSQPYQPMRVVNCPLNEYGRPAPCSVTTISDKQREQIIYPAQPVFVEQE